MRNISNNKKLYKLIADFADHDDRRTITFIKDVFMPLYPNKGISISEKDGVMFYNETNEYIEHYKLFRDFLNLIFVFQDLEKKGYIHLSVINNISYELKAGSENNGYKISYTSEISKMIYPFLHSEIFVSQDFIDYVNNNFKTPEQLTNYKNLTIAKWGIICSVFIGIASIWVNYQPTKNEAIQKELENIKQVLQQKTIYSPLNDTLKVEQKFLSK